MPRVPHVKTSASRVNPVDSTRRRDLTLSPFVLECTILPDPLPETVDAGYLFRVSLDGLNLPTTRVLRVSKDATFHDFNYVLQIAFGWKNDHEYMFDVGCRPRGKRHTSPLFSLTKSAWGSVEDFKNSQEHTLEAVFESPNLREHGFKVTYTWDMGDSWHHNVQWLGAAESSLAASLGLPADQKSFCIAGEWREHLEYGKRSQKEPWKWDMKRINKALGKLGEMEGEVALDEDSDI